MATLLEKALAAKNKRSLSVPSSEEVDLALAYFRAEITGDQATAAVAARGPRQNAAQRMATILRNAAAAGMVRIERAKAKAA